MSLKEHEFDRIVEKLELRTRHAGDLLAWFEYKGVTIVRTKRSWGKRGRDLPFQHAIRQQLKLTEDQLRALVACTLSRQDYVDLLTEKGLISPELK